MLSDHLNHQTFNISTIPQLDSFYVRDLLLATLQLYSRNT